MELALSQFACILIGCIFTADLHVCPSDCTFVAASITTDEYNVS